MLLPRDTLADVRTPLNPPRAGSHGDVKKVVVVCRSRGIDPPPNDIPFSVVMLASLPSPNADTPFEVTDNPGMSDASPSKLPCSSGGRALVTPSEMWLLPLVLSGPPS